MVNVLVVDDDKDFLRIVQKILETGGYAVVTATDAMDALEHLAKEVFDLVLTDANMPGGSGFDLVRTLRRHPATASLPIALLTGRREKQDVAKGMACGIDDYIIKPIDPDLFLDKISSLLQVRQQSSFPEIHFAESKVKIPAKWDITLEIATISERGLSFRSTIAAPVNSKFKISSPIFEQIEISPPNMRILKSTPDDLEPHIYITVVSFVGLTETERQKIRYWINSNIALTRQKIA